MSQRDVSGENLSSLLTRLEGELAAFGAPITAAFRPGVPAGELVRLLAAEQLRPPVDVQTLFGWHDGAATGPTVYGTGFDFTAGNALAAGWHVLSLADALDYRRWYQNLFAREGIPELMLPSSWLPVLHANDKGLLCADCAVQTPPLYIVDPQAALPEIPPTPQFESLGEFVGLLLRLFDEGLIHPDPNMPGAAGVEFSELTGRLRRLATW